MGHRMIEHTADLAMELEAPSEAELLAEGARAVVSLLTEGRAIEGRDQRRLRVTSIDREDRLVQWLNEVLLLATVHGFIVASAELQLNEAGLEALLTGMEDGWDLLEQELKSVTYHDLLLEQRELDWFARIVIDV
jgi:SHS2 domain-containing protein